METAPRIWVYTRCLDNLRAAQEQLDFLRLKARLNGRQVVGSSADWQRFRRGGYRTMCRAIRKGNADIVYLCSMGSISRREQRLLRFFKLAMRHGVKVRTFEYDLRTRANAYKIGHKVERWALKHGYEFPWI